MQVSDQPNPSSSVVPEELRETHVSGESGILTKCFPLEYLCYIKTILDFEEPPKPKRLRAQQPSMLSSIPSSTAVSKPATAVSGALAEEESPDMFAISAQSPCFTFPSFGSLSPVVPPPPMILDVDVNPGPTPSSAHVLATPTTTHFNLASALDIEPVFADPTPSPSPQQENVHELIPFLTSSSSLVGKLMQIINVTTTYQERLGNYLITV